MLYLLTNSTKQAPWQPRYERTYLRLLVEHSIPHRVVSTLDDVPYLTDNDHLWVMHYKDLLSLDARTAERTIYRISGTSVHPYCYQVDEKQEQLVFDTVGFNLSFHPRMTELLRRFYPSARFYDTGYPIDVPVFAVPVERKPKTIVVGGRLSPDKQFMLSAFLLQPYVDAGWTVTFCYPDNGGKDTVWMERQGGFARYERRGFNFQRMSNSDWLRTLAASEFYFTASLGDTACCSCVEAVKMGAYPLVPRIGQGLPAYDTYLNVGYEPFSASSLDQLIRDKPPIEVDDTWISSEKFMQRFKAEVLAR